MTAVDGPVVLVDEQIFGPEDDVLLSDDVLQLPDWERGSGGHRRAIRGIPVCFTVNPVYRLQNAPKGRI